MDKQIFLNHLLTEQKQLKEEIESLNETLGALEIIIARYSGVKPVQLKQPSLFGGTISDKDTLRPDNIKRAYTAPTTKNAEDRVLEALNAIGKGTARDVGKVLLELYPKIYDEAKANTTAKLKLSDLNKHGKISGSKIQGSNSFLYRIKKEEVA